MIACGAALLSSAYRFCSADAKTEDHHFTGFPSYWNIVALYAYVFQFSLPSWFTSGVILVLAALVFAPLKFIYPSRARWMKRSTIILGAIWASITLIVILRLPERDVELATWTLVYPAYYWLLSLYEQFVRRA